MTSANIGNTIEIDVTIRNSDGTAIPLSGSTFVFNAASWDGFLVTKTELDGIEMFEETDGLLRVTIDPEDTSELTSPTNLYWDLTMTDVFDAVRTVSRGRIALRRPVGS